MIKNITIKNIFRNDTKKDGTPYKDRNGKPFRVVVLVPETEDGQSVKLSYCEYSNKTDNWNPGDEVLVAVERNGDFLNFKPASKVDLLEHRVEKLEALILKDETSEHSNQ